MVPEVDDDGRVAILRQPVDLTRIDVGLARTRAGDCASLAATLVNDLSRDQISVKAFARLCEGSTQMVHDGFSSQGLRINGLCQISEVGQGHVRDHFAGAFDNASALAVRALLMEVRSPVIYDAVFEQRVDTREARSLGVVNGGIRYIGIAPTSSNFSCPERIFPLVTGTSHDRQHPAADHAAIEEFGADLGYEIPSSVPDHLALLHKDHPGLRDLVRRSSDRLRDLGLGRQCRPHNAFPDILLIPCLSRGPALPDRDTGELYVPGRDPEMIELTESLKRPVMLSMGQLQLDRDEVERLYPRTPLEDLRDQRPFGIAIPEFGVEYRGNRRVLLRFSRYLDDDGAVGIANEAWRLVGFAGEQQRGEAVAIAEHRARETWHDTCLKQFIRRAQPGLLQAREPRIRAGLNALQMVGNAAIVAADRLALASP